jgi:hypothetical protein
MSAGVYDCIFLVTLPDDHFPAILTGFPSSASLPANEIPYFEAAVRPSLHPLRSDVIYAFNTPMYICYSLFFQAALASYSIVIVSRRPFAAFFYRLFQSVISEFSQNPDCSSDPYNRFAFLCSIVTYWPMGSVPEELLVSLPSVEYNWSFSGEDYTFTKFDPACYFSAGDVKALWNCMFTGQPVLLLCDDSELASKAVFSVLSLMSPMQYAEPICIWLNVTDPRFVSLVTEQSDLGIVATDSVDLAESCDPETRRIFRPKELGPPETDGVASQCRLRVRRAVSIAKYLLENFMIYDMYYDVLERPMCSPSLENELNQYKKYDLPSAAQFALWEKTETFKRWRRERDNSGAFRDAVLNTDPETIFRDKTKDQLLLIKKRIGQIRKDYARDAHVLAVLKRHRAILSRMIAERP